jgi:L-threonylcarbamoyladenylate synthase
MTVVLRIDPEQPEADAIERAASIIRRGGLVAFPTETVYGLGADAMSEQAVLRVFEAKGRPADNPLIVHVCDTEMLRRVAAVEDDRVERLAGRFWPGPLTIVLERGSEVAPSVSAGLRSVAVRMPGHKVALSLIRRAQTPVAAPSANLSGRPSPTCAEHVLADLESRIDMILDAGQTNIGIESTVLDLTSDPPAILRPGWVTPQQLASSIGPVATALAGEELRRSPGTRHRHYSPRARVLLVEGASPGFLQDICEQNLREGSVAFIGHSAINLVRSDFHQTVLDNSAECYARAMYAALREADEMAPVVIVVEGIDVQGEGAAVMDRLRRAASEVIRPGNQET